MRFHVVDGQLRQGCADASAARPAPVNGTYTNGDPAINALGCSGHWFTVREDRLGRYAGNYLTANAWYEHGTRFLAVNKRTGTIKQVGFFQPVRGSASSAYWVPGTDYVYVVDYQRGVDILKFDPTAAPPSAAETTQSWLAKLHTIDVVSQQERFWCRQAMLHPVNRGTLSHGLQIGVRISRTGQG